MVKVRMLTTAAGPAGVFVSGTQAEMDEAPAALLVEAGAAEYVEPVDADAPSGEEAGEQGSGGAGGQETATIETPERAVGKRERARPGRKGGS